MAFTKHPYAAKSGNPIFEDEVSCENEKWRDSDNNIIVTHFGWRFFLLFLQKDVSVRNKMLKNWNIIMEYPLEQLLTGKYTLGSVEKGYFDPVGE